MTVGVVLSTLIVAAAVAVIGAVKAVDWLIEKYVWSCITKARWIP